MKVFQPPGHAALYFSSQYCINAIPLLEYTNCCQPRHSGFGDPLHAADMKGLVLIWRENSEMPPVAVLSMLVTPLTRSNDPSAAEMVPVGIAAKSVL